MAFFTAIAGFGTTVGATLFGVKLTGLAAFGLGLLTQTAMIAALNALVPKPQVGKNRGYTVNTRGSAQDHQIIYGEARVGGVVVFEESVEGAVDDPEIDNQFLLQVYVHAGHEIESYTDVYIDGRRVTKWWDPNAEVQITDLSTVANGTTLIPDELLRVDVNGNDIPSSEDPESITNRYSRASDGSNRRVNYLIMRFYDGTQTTADAGLVADSEGKWTSAHILRDTAYMVTTMGYDPKVFPNGVPNILVEIKGKKLYDPRTTNTVWSDNPALCIRDYLTSDYGLDEDASAIDDTLFAAQADVCDETVLSGATRYTCNGAFTTQSTPYDILGDLLTSMGGLLWYAQGNWRVKAAKWAAPTLTLTDDDLRSSVSIKTRHSRQENFNIVRGTFRGSESNWQVTDYPQVTNVTDTATSVTAGSFVVGQIYKISSLGTTDWNIVAGTTGVTYSTGEYVAAADPGSGTGTALETTNAYLDVDNGMESVLDFDLPFTDNSAEARRLARILLERNRQQISVSATFGLRAFELQVGDVVSLTLERFGWSAKTFEVTQWSFGMASDLTLEVQLALREISEEVFDELDDGVVFELDNTTLTDPFYVPAINLTATEAVRLIDNKPVRVVRLQTSTTVDSFLVQSVRYFYKLSSESDYKFFGEAGLGEFISFNIPPGTYDFRAAGVSEIGATGEFEEVTNFAFRQPLINRFGETYNGAFETLDFSGWVEEGYFTTAEVVQRDTASSVTLEKTAPFEAMARFDEADGLNPSGDLRVRVTGLIDSYIFLSWGSLIPVRPDDQVSLSWWQGEVDQVGFEDFLTYVYYEYYDDQQNRLFDETTTVTNILRGNYYKIETSGTFDWTTVGAPNSTVGTEFRATSGGNAGAAGGAAYLEVSDIVWTSFASINPDEWTLLQGNVTVPAGAFYCKPRFTIIDNIAVNTPGYITGVKFFVSEPTNILSEHSITESSSTAVSTTNLTTDNVEEVVASTTVTLPSLLTGNSTGQTLDIYSNATGNIDFTGSATDITMRLYVDGVNVASQLYRADSGFNLSAITSTTGGSVDVELRATSPDVSEVTITEAIVIGLALKR